MGRFLGATPTPVDNFRGIILFGRNVASYKFALAQSLIDLAEQGRYEVSLEELAVPYALHLTEHLAQAPRQTTSPRSQFLEACRKYNSGHLDQSGLTDITVRLGFNNVIDAFHVVANGEVGTRFFRDERKGKTKGIVLTDAVGHLLSAEQFSPRAEVNGRWRLVETAWDLGLDTSVVRADQSGDYLLTRDRRTQITGSRGALNGYQRGACFYCYRHISIRGHDSDLADVDHVIPHTLQRRGVLHNLDGVWNLVLACRECNRGTNGKFHAVPALKYIERLNLRNEYLIASAHPLRETLIAQTGASREARRWFLQSTYNEAQTAIPITWSAPVRGIAIF